MGILVGFLYIRLNVASFTSYWNQLIQNEMLDLRALLNMLLPHIEEDGSGKEMQKKSVTSLNDLYLAKNPDGRYKFTNMQHNRCVRLGGGLAEERPFLPEYLENHMALILSSVNGIGSSLYVNWVDVLPIPPREIKSSNLYRQTTHKIMESQPPHFFDDMDYIDYGPGLSFQTFYEAMGTFLFHEVVNYKWIMYDVIEGKNLRPYLYYLEKWFPLQNIWDGKIWSQLTQSETAKWVSSWQTFLNSTITPQTIIITTFYYYLVRNYSESDALQANGELILTTNMGDVDDDDINVRDPAFTRDAKRGMSMLKVESVYGFLQEQLTQFRKTIFYHLIRENDYKPIATIRMEDADIDYLVSFKNLYNFAKNMIHYRAVTSSGIKYTPFPQRWNSLTSREIQAFYTRLYDIPTPFQSDTDVLGNEWIRENNKPNWFTISQYVKRMYPKVERDKVPTVSRDLYYYLKKHVVFTVMRAMALHGTLSQFTPTPALTDRSVTSGQNLRSLLASVRFNPKDRERWMESYYWLTGDKFRNMPVITRQGERGPERMHYFDYLSSKQAWTFTYAMNWVSQTAFFHKYRHCRVIFVTGATGVGKSTQIPKLIWYSQRIVSYLYSGKVACTQPRVGPTVNNAINVAEELGVPIEEYTREYGQIPTTNYYMQYAHQEGKHIGYEPSFLRFMTDGTLLNTMTASPFLTKTSAAPSSVTWTKKYSDRNVYDDIIVDEAHEHNTNMDVILTLARSAVYLNNRAKLIIVSATMDDDEPIYRSYYRDVNDNRCYPPDIWLEKSNLDRANMDRRIHISEPGQTTRFEITDLFPDPREGRTLSGDNYQARGVTKALEIAKNTSTGNCLLFMATEKDIREAVATLNAAIPRGTIAIPYYSKLTNEEKRVAETIGDALPYLFWDGNTVRKNSSRLNLNTRAIIVATNIAEASLTIENLKHVIDTGISLNVIYNPLTGKDDVKKLLISASSSKQRRGRVGRTASGTVHYLYNWNMVANKKTSYGIADSNTEGLVRTLITGTLNDLPVLTAANDPNNPAILLRNPQLGPATSWSELLGNPHFIKPLLKNYTFQPRLADDNLASQYYYWYGIHDGNMTNWQDLLRSDPKGWFLSNHDDYSYQAEHPIYQPYFTGIPYSHLRDSKAKFWIIHPDENVIARHPLTRYPIGYQKSQSASDDYYQYVLKNGLAKMAKTINTLKSNGIIFCQSSNPTSATIAIPGLNGVDSRRLEEYWESLEKSPSQCAMVYPYTLMQEVTRELNITELMANSNYLNWWFFAQAKDMDETALMMMFLTETNTLDWCVTRRRNDIKNFISKNKDPLGDLHFLYKIWSKIRAILKQDGVLNTTSDSQKLSQFQKLKSQYLVNPLKLSRHDYLLMKKLEVNNLLNTTRETEYFLRQTQVDLDNIRWDKIDKVCAIYDINSIRLKKTVLHVLTLIHRIQVSGIKSSTKLLQLNTHLNFPDYFTSQDPYWRLLETFLRAHPGNVMERRGREYINPFNNTSIPRTPVGQYNQTENTVLVPASNQYIGFVRYDEQSENSGVLYQIPVMLKWLVELNPLFYNYHLTNPETSNNIANTSGIARAKSYLKRNDLLKFVRQMGNEEILSQEKMI